jgi:hypothetical protein
MDRVTGPYCTGGYDGGGGGGGGGATCFEPQGYCLCDGTDRLCWDGQPAFAATPGRCHQLCGTSGSTGGGGGGGGGGGDGSCWSNTRQEQVVQWTYVTSAADGFVYQCQYGGWVCADVSGCVAGAGGTGGGCGPTLEGNCVCDGSNLWCSGNRLINDDGWGCQYCQL